MTEKKWLARLDQPFFCIYIFLISFISENNLIAAHMMRRTYIAVYNVAMLPSTPEQICIIRKTTRATKMMAMIAA